MTGTGQQQQPWKDAFTDLFYRNTGGGGISARGGQENVNMGGGCGAGLMTARHNPMSGRMIACGADEEARDTMIYHKNMGSMNEDQNEGGSRMFGY